MPTLAERWMELGEARGRELGEARGRELGEARGRELGEARGRELGEARGRELGEARGKREGLAVCVFRILEHRGLALSEAQRQRVLECQEVAMLEAWLDRALVIASAEELFV